MRSVTPQRIFVGLLVLVGSSLVGWSGRLHAQGYALDPDRTLRIGSASARPGELVEIPVTFDNPDTGDFCSDTAAYWSIAIAHDSAVVEPVEIEFGADLLAALGSGSPDFSSIAIEPEGVQMALIFSLSGAGPSLANGLDLELYRVTYEAVAVGESELTPCDCLPWTLIVLYFGTQCSDQEYTPVLESGLITVDESNFVRGDASGDGAIDLFDPIKILYAYFVGTEVILCDDAADGDDNGQVEPLVDAIYLLSYLFAGGPPPPGPTSCGADPTADAIGCLEVAACP